MKARNQVVEGSQAAIVVFAILQQLWTAQDQLSVQVGFWESLLPLNKSVKHLLSKFSAVKPLLARILGVHSVCVVFVLTEV